MNMLVKSRLVLLSACCQCRLVRKNAFKNVIVTGTLAGNDGRKMSKSFGNYTDPNELMDKYSADSLRFLLLSSPVLNGEDFRLQDKDVGDVARKLSMIWNMYDFFTLYAEVDGWDSGLEKGELPKDPTPELNNLLDEWIVSRVHQLSQEVDEHMQRYDLPNAIKPILPFIDDASNWYVRRSRKRFWKADNDSDKQQAYKTLHYVLTQLSLILAPFTPFLAEELYQKLTGGESVHLLDWCESGHVNELLLRDMESVRQGITEALAVRAKAAIKVRQPLSRVTLMPSIELLEDHRSVLEEIVKEEVNVKTVVFGRGDSKEVILDIEMSPELKQEGLMREIIRNVQKARKDAGLEVDDRIHLVIKSDDDSVTTVLNDLNLTDIVQQETLADSINNNDVSKYTTTAKIDGAILEIGLTKVTVA